MDELGLQGMDEAFRRRIVVAAPPAAHGCPGADRSQVLPVDPGDLLAAALRVANKPGLGSLPLHGHQQRGQRPPGSHVVAHRPADDLARRKIKAGGQIQPPPRLSGCR